VTSKQSVIEYPHAYECLITDKTKLFTNVIACGNSSGVVKLYDLRIKNDAKLTLDQTSLLKHMSPITSLEWCGNDLYRGTQSGLVECFDIRQVKPRFSTDVSSNGGIRGLHANGGSMVAACKNGAVVVSSAYHGRFINKFSEGKRNNLQCMSVSSKVMVTGGVSGIMSVHDFSDMTTTIPTTEDEIKTPSSASKQTCKQQ
jgi:WD40 repeat protein